MTDDIPGEMQVEGIDADEDMVIVEKPAQFGGRSAVDDRGASAPASSTFRTETSMPRERRTRIKTERCLSGYHFSFQLPRRHSKTRFGVSGRDDRRGGLGALK